MNNRKIRSTLGWLIPVLVVLLELSACAKIEPTLILTPGATSPPTPTPIFTTPPAQTTIDMTIDLITGWTWEAQTFTVPANGYVMNGASVNISKVGSPPNPLTVGIRAVDSNGHPTGPDLTNGTIAAPSVKASTDFIGFTDVTFSSPPSLKGNTKYALVIYSSGESSADYYSWWIERSDVFPGGNLEQSVDSGSTWIFQPYDASFKLNVIPGTAQGQ